MGVKMRKKCINSNPVAKHARTFNKSEVFEDRKKAMKRGKVKHKRPQWAETSFFTKSFSQSTAGMASLFSKSFF